MLWSICVLVAFLLLVPLMTFYLSKPVLKRFLMGVPLTLRCCFVSHNDKADGFSQGLLCHTEGWLVDD